MATVQSDNRAEWGACLMSVNVAVNCKPTPQPVTSALCMLLLGHRRCGKRQLFEGLWVHLHDKQQQWWFVYKLVEVTTIMFRVRVSSNL